jgi:uncharacterized protein YdhG (YjbR/CyaY superfamily)
MAKAEAEGFTTEERAAMKERAKEVRRTGAKVDGLTDVLDKIAEMDDSDRAIAERVHAIVTDAAPALEPKTWYGQPAYARDGKVVLFFQAAGKFKTRYATLGFNDVAALDDGSVWPVAFALSTLTPADEEMIAALVRRAVR